MKSSHIIALSVAIAATAGILIYIVRNSKTRHMLDQIADEGYETAQDILFPGKKFQPKHLRYGPVIPGY